jgi:hypothetical protein
MAMARRLRPNINGLRKAPINLMQKFRIARPKKTHWRNATCSEVNCKPYQKGFRTIVGKDTQQAAYIRGHLKIGGFTCGRPYQEQITADGMAIFTFPAGTECFDSHPVQVGRGDIFIKQTVERKSVLEPDQFIWLMNENHYAIKKALKEG